MNYKPSDYTDVGQATVLAKRYGNILRYSNATGYLRYDGRCWQVSNLDAQSVAQALTEQQLAEANDAYNNAQLAMQSSGAAVILANVGKSKAVMTMTDEQQEIYQDYLDAKTYQAYALDRRSTQHIAATLQEARPKLQIDSCVLDANPYLLCTPAATYDLRKGLQGARKHSPNDYITRITAVSPGSRGAELWQSFLLQIFSGDQDLVDYVQQICGLAAIGKVLQEAIVIAYGGGRNGKSTLCNTIARVLGTYSDSVSTDVLINSSNRNIMPDLAELRGKRLILASELPCKAQMDDAIIKHLCSTDSITGAKKYKDTVT
ncbi:MAG: DNA primase, partial [Clostridia bacterium]|nr:DNA primase [Clostridia bacterium]